MGSKGEEQACLVEWGGWRWGEGKNMYKLVCRVIS